MTELRAQASSLVQQLASKQRFDPAGLLNPGKLRGWDQREALAARAARGDVSLRTLPKF